VSSLYTIQSLYTLADNECSVVLLVECLYRGYSIIGSGSGFAVNLGSDSRGKSNDFRSVGVSSVNGIHSGFGFIVNLDPDPIIESPL